MCQVLLILMTLSQAIINKDSISISLFFFYFCEFFAQPMTDNFSLESLRVYWVLLRILTDLNNSMVGITSFRSLIFTSFNLLCRPFQAPQLLLVSSSLSCSTIFVFLLVFFFKSLVRFKYLFFFSISVIFTLWSMRTAKCTNWQVLFSW